MNAKILSRGSRSGDTAAFPAARRAEKVQRRPGRIAGRLLSFYDLVSGPAMTARERTRAEVADYRNSWARTLLGN